MRRHLFGLAGAAALMMSAAPAEMPGISKGSVIRRKARQGVA